MRRFLLQYTGGTTGPGRGAELTHYNLVANAYQNRLWLPDVHEGREVTLAVLRLFHAYGLTCCLTVSMLLAGTLVLVPRFDLDAVFAAIDTYRPTLFPGVPPIYQAIVDSPAIKDHDLKSIRACISGAMKLPLETQEQFERLSGGRLVDGYGMTETSPVTHGNRVYGKRKAVFRGYWNRPDETAAGLTAAGWVRTGDIATMDDEGYFRIVDRKTELIIAGGFNVYPSEVEEVLFSHPAVADAVVVGIPDRYRGETVKAYVVTRPGADVTEDDIRAHCATGLTAYKVPKAVEFRESLPRTMVGKVLRRVLVQEELAATAADTAAP